MKIGYIIPISMGFARFNGVKVQAEAWANTLIEKGHVVNCINPWSYQDLQSYDVIHIFSSFKGILPLVKYIYGKNHNIVISPIIDSNNRCFYYNIASRLSIPRLGLDSIYSELRKCNPFVKRWLSRTQFEASYINKCFGVPLDKISIVPLSYRIKTIDFYPQKENFCLHVSYLTDKRKNVDRLIDAAIKYNFNLVLAGGISSVESFHTMQRKIDSNPNISYLGRVSDDELVDLYTKAKVFALPSLYEGVGMVGVEAAAYGCDIVITNIGGPKEYYEGMSYCINPYDVDAIGNSIRSALSENKYQPSLQNSIISKYNLSHCVDLLIDTYSLL